MVFHCDFGYLEGDGEQPLLYFQPHEKEDKSNNLPRCNSYTKINPGFPNNLITILCTYKKLDSHFLSEAVKKVSDVEVEVPYFLQCNKDRFPYWFGSIDPRNELLRESLSTFRMKHNFIDNIKNDCPFLFNVAFVPGLRKGEFGTVKTCPIINHERIWH